MNRAADPNDKPPASHGRRAPRAQNFPSLLREPAFGTFDARGAALMPPTMGDRAKAAEDNFIGCYPKPGLPKPMDPGVFNEAPEPASRRLGEMTPNSLLNLVDGGRYTRPGCARTS